MRNSILEQKLDAFCAVLEAAQLQSLIDNGVDCEGNRTNAKTHFHVGGKYARVDLGGGGRYMVVLATGEIFGIKAYGVIHRGHAFGTLDTIAEWDWRNYRACRALPFRRPPVADVLSEVSVTASVANNPPITYLSEIKIWSAIGHTPKTNRGGAFCDELLSISLLVSDPADAKYVVEKLMSRTPHARRGYFNIPSWSNQNTRSAWL